MKKGTKLTKEVFGELVAQTMEANKISKEEAELILVKMMLEDI